MPIALCLCLHKHTLCQIFILLSTQSPQSICLDTQQELEVSTFIMIVFESLNSEPITFPPRQVNQSPI
ncbi:hypothetical protein ACB092_08G210000 [Castanea dentata]